MCVGVTRIPFRGQVICGGKSQVPPLTLARCVTEDESLIYLSTNFYKYLIN